MIKIMLKKILAAVSAMAAVLSMLTGCKGTLDANDGLIDDLTESSESAVDESKIEWLPDVEIHNFDMPEIGEKIAVISVKDYGDIKIKLFPDDAAKGVENFVGLTDMGYYDEIIFHRVIPNFMIQGGDPKGNGTGGKSLWGDEFEGGTSEHLYHFTGAVAYGRSQGSTTSGSQFYIVNTPDGYLDSTCAELNAYDPQSYNWPANVAEKYAEVGGTPFLDGNYTIFGQVFEGMDVVRAIAQVETDENDKPLHHVTMDTVRIEEYKG